MPRKPMVYPGKSRTQAEEFYDEDKGMKPRDVEPPDGGWDSNYVPGFSDHRHLNEVKISKRQKPIEMPANLCWIPREGKAVMLYRKKGYETIRDATTNEAGDIKSEMLNKHGWDVPEQAKVQKDGTIQKDDLVLAYVDGDTYRQVQQEEAEYRKYLETGGGSENIDMEVEESRKITLSDDDAGLA